MSMDIVGGLRMKNNKISGVLFAVILLILLLNAVISIANIVEDGAILRRVIPAVSWSIATIFWVVAYLRKNKREN